MEVVLLLFIVFQIQSDVVEVKLCSILLLSHSHRRVKMSSSAVRLKTVRGWNFKCLGYEVDDDGIVTEIYLREVTDINMEDISDDEWSDESDEA